MDDQDNTIKKSLKHIDQALNQKNLKTNGKQK
jgi:hypothetical protein